MVKWYIFSLLIIITCNYSQAIAQIKERQLFNKYIERHVTYEPAMFYTDSKYYSSRHVPDSLAILVRRPTDLVELIHAGLHNRTYSVSIENRDTTRLDQIFKLLAGFPHLNYLKLDDLGLFRIEKRKTYQLPESIIALKALQGIEFSLTQSIDMHDAVQKIRQLKGLRSLAFIAYPKALPASLSSLSNIQVISLSPKNLDSLNLRKVHWQFVNLKGEAPKRGPDEKALRKISQITFLQKLYLEYCMLGSAQELTLFQRIKALSIVLCEPDSSACLFQKLSELKKLENLSVRYVKDSLQSIQRIEKLHNLRSLSLISISSLKVHPEELQLLCQLQKLRSLNLNSNQVQSLPDFFAGLKQLHVLNLEGNELKKAPEHIFHLPRLTYLNLGSNKLRQIPDIAAYNCAELKSLKLSYNAITSLPAAILDLKKLQHLEVARNKISTLPIHGWQDLKELRKVDFSMNHLSIFPDGLQQISRLEEMNLANNDIPLIPDFAANGYKLKRLDLNSNKLTALPDHIGNCVDLEYLNLAGNMLTDLPASLGNCKKLIELDVHSESRKMSFDPDKTEKERFFVSAKNDVHLNHIRSLPEGLKDAPSLYQLNLSGNASIDGSSVFKVILGIPRPYFNVNVNGDSIKVVPDSEQWAKMEFYNLDIGNNQLATLPTSFANIKRFNNINLRGNPIHTASGVSIESISDREDMKLLYDEMGVELPGFNYSKAGYAIALAKRVSDAYYKKQWTKAVAYADKAMTVDSAAYATKVKWDEIGYCRYELKDYQGAIDDFAHFIEKEEKTNIHWGASLDMAQEYKASAHLALGESIRAAETHLYFARKYGHTSGFQKAAFIYKSIGDNKKYHQLIDSAVLAYQQSYDVRKKYNANIPDAAFALDYAELLIMAEKSSDAIKLIGEQPEKSFPASLQSTKSYLLTTAYVLNHPDSFSEQKQRLASEIQLTGKVTGWDFSMFNSWITSSAMNAEKRKQLLALQDMVR